jgi:hypothetical protein
MAVDGVGFCNVAVSYTPQPAGTEKRDAQGNLIIVTNEIITKGTITVNPESV